jgi:hypothetical protein
VKLVDPRNWSYVDRATLAVLDMLEKPPANDTAPVSKKRRKQWSETLRSAELAKVLERFR